MNKIVIGAVTAIVVGVGAAAGWYFLGKESGPGVTTAGSAPALDCANIKADVDATFASLPPEVKATYSGLECSASKLLFAELRFGFLGAGGNEDGAVRLERVVVDNAFAANAKTVFNPASYPAGQAPATAYLPLAGRLTAAKVTIGPQSGGGLSFENFDVADLAARQFAKAPPATMAELGAFGPVEIADILQAFSFSSIGLKNMVGGPADPATPGATKTVMTIASIALSAFDGKTLGAFDLKSLSTTADGDKGKVTVGSVALKGIGVADLATLASAAGGMVDEEALGVRALLSISAESAVLSDFEASGMDTPDDRVKLKSVSVEQLKALAFAKLSIDGLDGYIGDSGVAFGLDRLNVTGVDIGSALAPLTENGSADPDFTKLRIDGYELTGLSIGPKEGDKVTLASLVATSSDYVDGVATKGTGKLTGFVLPATIIPESDRQPLTDLGYEAIKLEATTDYTFDPATKTIDVKDVTIKVLDGGALSLKLKFGNFDIKALQEASRSFEPPAALFEASVIDASLAYTDDSLIDRVLKMVSKEMGQTPEDLLAQAKGFLQLQMAQAPGPVTKAAVEGVLAFVDSRKALTIALNPATPVVFKDLAEKMDDLEGVAAALGLTVKGK